MKLKFAINLQNFSAVAVAARLWEHDDVKKDIRKYFDNWESRVNTNPRNTRWLVIVKKVAGYVNALELPEKVLSLVQNAIIPIGERVFYWTMYLLHNLGLEYQYTLKIYWTPLGTIDENRCFQDYWVKVAGKSRVLQHPSPSDYDPQIFYLACIFNQKEFLKMHFKELQAKTQLFFVPFKPITNKSKLNKIIVLWLCLHFTKSKSEAVETYTTFGKLENTNTEFFLMSIDSGLFEATKYFWNQFNKSEKQNVILKAARKSMKFSENDYSEEKCIEILMFFLNAMTAKQRKDFINEEYVRLVEVFMEVWPYQEIGEKIFNKYYFDDERLHRETDAIMDSCFRRIIDCYKTARYADKEICRRMFKKVFDGTITWFMLPSIIDDDFLLLKLYECFDIPVLSIILNDRGLRTFKQKILDKGILKFKQLIMSRNFELLNKFVLRIFKSDAKKKKFKSRISFLPEILGSENYELADEVLTWLSDSVDERILIRKQIDAKKVCLMFRNFKCELIDQFLSWQYVNEGDRINAKEALKENAFVCDAIVKIWNENISDSESKCLEFLKWLCGTEEEAIKLKNNVIVNDDVVKKFCETLPSWKKFRRIEELFKFFLLTPDKILEIKTKMIKYSDKWINILVIRQKNFKLAETVINWIFTDYGQKKEIIKSYINSLKGAELLVKMILSCKVDEVKPLVLLLNSWVKLYGNINLVKENLLYTGYLDDWDRISAVRQLNTLLDALASGAKITEEQINQLLPRKNDTDLNFDV